MKDDLTQARLKELLSYDPNTGIFRWKVHRRPQSPVGSVAGWDCGRKNIRIELGGKNYLAHRLAWLYVHGIWPDQIDHINGNRSDNHLANLRQATNSQNQANMAAKSNNKTGHRGISFRRNRYVVQLYKTENGEKYKVVGNFAKLEQAKIFVKIHSMRLHGEYSIFNRQIVNPRT